MSEPRSITPEVVVVWGAHPGYQYERDWLLQLLRPRFVHEVEWHQSFEPFVLPPSGRVVLVESARYLMEAEIRALDLGPIEQRRTERLQRLQDVQQLLIWHISDEQGFDGDRWYPSLPAHRPVLREFPHGRFERFEQVGNLPLGPTRSALINVPWLPASCRQHPWSLMGTLWPGTSRQQAVECFRTLVPNGFAHGSEGFGQGLATDRYVFELHRSKFSLCPEGHRHFETFRFYESLELGAIPLGLHTPEQLSSLFSEPWPLPVFRSWEQAAAFAQKALIDLPSLDALQLRMRCWWEQERHLASRRLQNGFAALVGRP
jgi:hypothetical protein